MVSPSRDSYVPTPNRKRGAGDGEEEENFLDDQVFFFTSKAKRSPSGPDASWLLPPRPPNTKTFFSLSQSQAPAWSRRSAEEESDEERDEERDDGDEEEEEESDDVEENFTLCHLLSSTSNKNESSW